MDVLPETLERLAARLETLERRVYTLEHPYEIVSSIQAPVAVLSEAPKADDTLRPAQAAGMFSVVGKAMLGIAGAYLLRAVAESGSIPMPSVAAIAIVYALLWLVAAARVPGGAWFAGATYACTSAMILSPMLWELTLNFKVLRAAETAAILGVYAIVATALAWKRNLAPLLWVGNVTAALVTMALSIATYQMAPFIVALLLMAALSEFAAARNRGIGVRPLVAAACDFALWAMIFIYSSPASTRLDYPEIGAPVLIALACALFAIDGVSVAIRTALLRQEISIYETGQTMVAFLLAASGVLYFGSSTGATVLGIVCMLLAGVNYTAAFALFHGAQQERNYFVFASWSAALFLAGGFLCLPPPSLSAVLGVAAVIAVYLGARFARLTLEFHGVVYLTAAAIVSGLLDYASHAFVLAIPSAPTWAVAIVSVCALLCYAEERPRPGEPWMQQLLHLVSATLAVGAAASLLISGFVGLASFGMNPGAHHIAFLRTLILCLVTLALAFIGPRLRRAELTRIGYALLVLIAAKLVFEDLRLGHLGFIAASIFLYALTLIAVPRLARLGQRVLATKKPPATISND